MTRGRATASGSPVCAEKGVPCPMHAPIPATKDLVLIGGGHTHALVLRAWGMERLPGVRVTLINPDPSAPYTGMLPGHLAGHYPRAALDIDLVRLARFAGARLILDRAVGIDREARQVQCAERAPISYDVVSLDVGITAELPALPGFAAHGVPAKPLGGLATRWAAFVEAAQAGRVAPDIAVIGGGVAGVEIALAMAHRLRGVPGIRVSVLDAGDGLTGVSARTRRILMTHLKDAGVTLHTHAHVTGVTADAVTVDAAAPVPSHFTVSAAGARPHDWLRQTDLSLSEGFVTVTAQLQSVSDPSVFATGDCAHLSHAPRPKAGVYAVRAAPVLFDNLRAALSSGDLRAYHPQKDYLKLISLGRQSAVGDRGGWALSGRWVWRLKDWIDQRFMNQFRDLPAMARPPLPPLVADGVREALGDGRAPCAGCGAKVGAAGLRAVLRDLPGPTRPDVVSGPGDDAAILTWSDQRQVVTTDHLRSFTDDPYVMGRVAAIHALGDIWAMGAQPQAALATIILPPLSADLQTRTLREVLAGATPVLRMAGADLVGGHTSLGSELTIGFTLTGVSSDAPITLEGARAGDCLILTQPIGSGTILAAEMTREATGAMVAEAWTWMQHSQGPAADILRHAHAMTDVTGFGLAGHLMTLLEASQVSAGLSLAAVPIMRGADALAQAGVRSSLYPANRAVATRMRIPEGLANDPVTALLFDPQTAGGLLAAVDAAQAAETLSRLHAEGFAAAIIGTVHPGPPVIAVG